jgi:hypothetical protein
MCVLVRFGHRDNAVVAAVLEVLGAVKDNPATQAVMEGLCTTYLPLLRLVSGRQR